MTYSTNPDPLIRVKDAAEFLGIGKRTIHDLRARGELPEPTTITPRCKGWRQSILHAWLASREV
ncbi:MAG: helix-turn-helix domain-containing protein [Aquipseudomonas alcaligenes]|uniref:Helix-turn-helix domain-containing protein n=1 Tax=Aquipseudomonas alcaligenes TaxID=43263 RepID=A0A5C7VTZ9_AQUAC|nr:MAG: helix-turn-helix domain-containing protein [Pseudomonas alcaligenes]